MSSLNAVKSMLPPDTITTIGPGPAFPVRAAARGRAAAPSLITRTCSAIRRIACFVSFKLTTMQPSSTGRIRCHIRGKTLRPPAASTKDAFQFGKAWGDPKENDSAAGAAVSGSAPHTRVFGRRALIAVPTPVMRPPPPMLAITAAVSGASSRISSPIVAWPAMKL